MGGGADHEEVLLEVGWVYGWQPPHKAGNLTHKGMVGGGLTWGGGGWVG